jgi:hypothetical protein
LVRVKEMENFSRGPTFGDFVTVLKERSIQKNTVARLQSTRVQTPPWNKEDNMERTWIQTVTLS